MAVRKERQTVWHTDRENASQTCYSHVILFDASESNFEFATQMALVWTWLSMDMP